MRGTEITTNVFVQKTVKADFGTGTNVSLKVFNGFYARKINKFDTETHVKLKKYDFSL